MYGEEEVIEGEVIQDEIPDKETPISTDVVVAQAQQATLFHTSDPVEVVKAAAKVADALRDILARQGLTTIISGRQHVRVEGWQTVGSMLGVFAVKEWVEELPWPEPVPQAIAQQKERGLSFGYKASYRAQRTDGAVVGGGEADCKRTERTWSTRDDYAIKNMAQTRAMSRALRAPLGFIVTMAGYESTPAEEMPPDAGDQYQYGPAMKDREAPEKLSRATTFLLGGDAALAREVYLAVEKDAGGYFPNIANRAILHIARTARDAGVEIITTQPEGEAPE